MTRKPSMSDEMLASSLARMFKRWTELRDLSSREGTLLRAGLDRRHLGTLPYEAPIENFAPILAFHLVGVVGKEPSTLGSIEEMIRNVFGSEDPDAEAVLIELGRRTESILREAHIGRSGPPPRILNAYLHRIIDRLGMLDTAFLGPGLPARVTIDRLYVPLPTAAVLTASISESEEVLWEISGVKLLHGEKRITSQDGALRPPRLKEALAQVHAAVGAQSGPLPGEASRPLVLCPLGAGGASFNVDAFRVEETVAQFRRVLLVGDPGAGKSTAARHTAVSVAHECLAGTTKGTPLDGLIPVLVSVNALTRWDGFVSAARSSDVDVISAFTRHVWFEQDPDAESEFHRLSEEGNSILVLDGLDEVWFDSDDDQHGIDRRALLAESLERYLRNHPTAACLVTCRPEAEARFWPSLTSWGFASIRLPPVGTDHAEMLADKFLVLTGTPNRHEVRDRIRVLWTEGVEAVLSVPLYVALFAASLSAHPAGYLALSRSALLGKAVEFLAIRWSSTRSADELHGDPNAVVDRPEAEQQLTGALQRVALRSLMETQSVDEKNIGVDLGDILRELTYFKSGLYAAFTYLVEESGLFEEAGGGRFRFRLRPFEEYLGAAELVRGGGRRIEEFRSAMGGHPERWLEPIALASDLLATGLGPPAAAAAVGDVVLDWSRDSKGWPWSYLWLAATAIERLIDDYGLDVETGTCERLRERVRRGYPADSNISHYGRYRVGEIIGRVGDPRPGVGVEGGLPIFEWVRLPRACFELGVDDATARAIAAQSWARDWEMTYEQPAVMIEVGPFAVSRYPVTVQQFTLFLLADDGFENPRWWTGLTSFDHRRPPMSDSRSRRSDPATNVNWYDAVAFCRWASHGLGYDVRLPTEPQWEYAARGPHADSSRVFPWGNEYDSRRVNGLDSGLGRPTAVGLYWAGDGPWDRSTPVDLSGNVWEWCTTIHSAEGGGEFLYPYSATDGREDPYADDTHRRVVRGGSFTNLPFSMRTTMRGHDRPSLRTARQGFRVVRLEQDPGPA